MRAMVGGRLLFYEAAGRGEPVALLHGLGLDHQMWDSQVGQLARHFRVLAWDAPGHGQSERVHTPFTIEDLADDFCGLLLALGIDRLALVGFSIGGCIAQTVALKYPDRVTALGLVATSGSFRTVEQMLLARARAVRMAGLGPEIEPIVQRAFTDGFRAEHPATVELYRAVLRDNDPEMHARACEAVAAFHVAADLHSIEKPTLVVAGDQDTSTPLEMARAIHEEIGGSHLWIVPNARHCIPIEHAAAFNERLLAFLTEALLSTAQ